MSVRFEKLLVRVYIRPGSIGADVMIVDSTAPSYVERCWNEVRLFSEGKRGKRNKHVTNGATMVPSVMSNSAKWVLLLRASCRV